MAIALSCRWSPADVVELYGSVMGTAMVRLVVGGLGRPGQ